MLTTRLAELSVEQRWTSLLVIVSCALHLALLNLPVWKRVELPQDTIVMVGLYTDSRPGRPLPPVQTPARPRTSSKHQAVKPDVLKKAKPDTISLNKTKSSQAPVVEQVAEAGPASAEPSGPFSEGPAVEGSSAPVGARGPAGSGSSPVEIGFGGGSGPRFKHQVAPQYPLMARRQGVDGRVVLRLTIDECGRLVDVEVVEDAPYGFVAAAVTAVRRSSFYPAQVDGRPVVSRALLPIRFSLKAST